MDERTFQTKFDEILEKIDLLPEGQRHELQSLADETRERRTRIRATVSALQESLDYLRLTVKYMVFDLEATRRENAHLRRIVEQSNQDYKEGGDAGFLEDDMR